MATPQRAQLVVGDKFDYPKRGQAKVLAFKDGGLLVKVEGNNEILSLEDAQNLSGKGGWRPLNEEN